MMTEKSYIFRYIKMSDYHSFFVLIETGLSKFVKESRRKVEAKSSKTIDIKFNLQ